MDSVPCSALGGRFHLTFNGQDAVEQARGPSCRSEGFRGAPVRKAEALRHSRDHETR